MTKDEKIQYCVDSVWEIEGVRVPAQMFEEMSDEQLEEEIEWFDYLHTK